ncbi:unnamed protein product [Diatraea saccharalis]|uniref:Aprataxin C2HE/C2H2/C2HC zinc finger domain-containing protein n=1 Tax=Diatraea saccharalis TaxID=40085 RepID=A0A9N9R5W5_9NEOP|nr:unnamed protein product [Diatraea saccharalis]
MPLSGAEKTRRYREKLKRDRPEEYAAQCQRNLQKIKSKKKKISDMSLEEAKAQRQTWREQKRKSKARNKKCKNSLPNETSNPEIETDAAMKEKNIKRYHNKCRVLVTKCRRYQNLIKELKTRNETYKKRNQRITKRYIEKIAELENINKKMKAREEILESTLKRTYKNSRTHKEKKILRQLVHNAENKTYVSNKLGLICKPKEKKKIFKRPNIPEITNFYLRDDVSRSTAGRKETRTRKKIKKQIRYLSDNLVNLFNKYRKEGGRYGLSTFIKYKPFFVIAPRLNSRDTCLCIKHSNIEFQHDALKKAGALKTRTIRNVLDSISCDIKNYYCMYDKCTICSDLKPFYEQCPDKNVSWFQWKREDHVYTKMEEHKKKEITTKKTAKVIITGNLQELKNNFEKDLHKFKKHYFNMLHQQNQYQIAISNQKDNEVVIVCDFSENYEAKLANEVQSLHFGASKNQITLHTGMVFWRDESQSFCTISESNNHRPAAIWAHLTPIINIIKNKTPNVTILHFYTDGPSSQYRQKNNFYLLTEFTKKLGFDYATWSYFESGHGKSVADGIGGCVKRTLDRKVSQGVDVADAEDAHKILNECLKVTKVFLIKESDIDEITEIFPNTVPPLKGTLQIHQVVTQKDQTTIKFRNISCFCGPVRGQCDCYSPQLHNTITTRKCLSFNKRTNLSQNFDPQPSTSTSIAKKRQSSNKIIYLKEIVEAQISTTTQISNQQQDYNKRAHLPEKVETQHTSIPISKIRKSSNKRVNFTGNVKPQQFTSTPISKNRQSSNNFSKIFEPQKTLHLLPSEHKPSIISPEEQTSPEQSRLSMVFKNNQSYSNDNSGKELLLEIGSLIPSDLDSFNNINIADSEDFEKLVDLNDIEILPMIILPDKKDKTKPEVTDNTINDSNLIKNYSTSKKKGFIECQKCTCTILDRKAKCMACQKWFCEECVDGPIEFDYICEKCFEDIIKELKEKGSIKKISPDLHKKLLATPLQCNQCSIKPKNMPELKDHLKSHYCN